MDLDLKEALLDAIIHNNVGAVKKLLERGVDPNLTLDHANVTPLHYAAQNNTLEIAELLFTAGADIENETDEGQTPIDIAKECNHGEMLQLLMKLKNQMMGKILNSYEDEAPHN